MPHADEHLAAFCTTLPELRCAVTRQGLGRVLDDVLARVRAGHPLQDELPRLGIPADVLRGSDLKLIGIKAGRWARCTCARRTRAGGRCPGSRAVRCRPSGAGCATSR